MLEAHWGRRARHHLHRPVGKRRSLECRSSSRYSDGGDEDAVGRPLDELLAPVLPEEDRTARRDRALADQTVQRTGIFEMLARGNSWSGTLAKSRRDGSGPPGLVAATPFTSTGGEVIGHVVLCSATGAGLREAGPARTCQAHLPRHICPRVQEHSGPRTDPICVERPAPGCERRIPPGVP